MVGTGAGCAGFGCVEGLIVALGADSVLLPLERRWRFEGGVLVVVLV